MFGNKEKVEVLDANGAPVKKGILETVGAAVKESKIAKVAIGAAVAGVGLILMGSKTDEPSDEGGFEETEETQEEEE